MENRRDTIQKVLARNKEFALNYDAAALSPQPQMRLVVIACMDTRITLAALGLKPVLDPNFLEQNFGDWTGRRHDDLAREFGAAYHEFWKAPAENRPPNGESFADQVERVRDAMAALPSGDVVLVVHSGTVRAALAIALGIAPESALRFRIDPLSLTRIDRVEGGWSVICVNC